ncbi:MAG: acetamidase, partial [Lysinibacillus sp.]
VGTGANLNDAVFTAVERASNLLGLKPDEIHNRATIAGDLSIARMPGAVTLTAQFPKTVLKKAKLYKWVKKQYD